MYSGKTSYINYQVIMNRSQDVVVQSHQGHWALFHDGLGTWGSWNGVPCGICLSLLTSSCPPLPYLFSMGLTWDFSQHESLRVVKTSPIVPWGSKRTRQKLFIFLVSGLGTNISILLYSVCPCSQRPSHIQRGVRYTLSANGRSVNICMTIFYLNLFR